MNRSGKEYEQYIQFADAICEMVPMDNAVAFYLPGVKQRFNRIPCPVHNGKDYNLHFNKDRWHCFVCKEGGNVVGFVKHSLNLNFYEAVERLNNDFHCGLPIGRRPTLREQRDAQHRYDEMQALRASEEAEKQAYSDLYNALWDRYALYDTNRRLYVPQNIDEEFNPLYVEAVKKISYIEYLIDVLL